jgi:hypothetical protein
MAIDRQRIETLFEEIGRLLQKPTTLCIFGSSPAILLGQQERQTQDVDVWHPMSSYDAGDLRQACTGAGALYDPTHEVDPDEIYIQIVRQGIVALPHDFEVEVVAHYGNLTVAMPAPVVLSATKLVRSSESDIEDIVWWIKQRQLGFDDIALAVDTLPTHRIREVAKENLVLVRLIAGSK